MKLSHTPTHKHYLKPLLCLFLLCIPVLCLLQVAQSLWAQGNQSIPQNIGQECAISARIDTRLPQAWDVLPPTPVRLTIKNATLDLSPFKAQYTIKEKAPFQLQLWSTSIPLSWASPAIMHMLGDPRNSPLLEQVSTYLSKVRSSDNQMKMHDWKKLQLAQHNNIPVLTTSYRSLHPESGNTYNVSLIATSLEEGQLSIIEIWQQTGGKRALTEAEKQNFAQQAQTIQETLHLKPERVSIPLRQEPHTGNNVAIFPSNSTMQTRATQKINNATPNNSSIESPLFGPPPYLGEEITLDGGATVTLPPTWVHIANKLSNPAGLPNLGEKIIALRLSKKGDILAVLSAQHHRDRLTMDYLQSMAEAEQEKVFTKTAADVRQAIERMGTLEIIQPAELVKIGEIPALSILFQARFFGKSYTMQKFISSVKSRKFTLHIWELIPTDDPLAEECALIKTSLRFLP